MMRRRTGRGQPRLRLALAILTVLQGCAVLAQEEQGRSTSDLAKAAQSPISDVISLPFQNNLNFAIGPHSKPQDILNIQPVILITLNQDWNVITRWIVPVISQPSPHCHQGSGVRARRHQPDLLLLAQEADRRHHHKPTICLSMPNMGSPRNRVEVTSSRFHALLRIGRAEAPIYLSMLKTGIPTLTHYRNRSPC
jgi:hypothetical protein